MLQRYISYMRLALLAALVPLVGCGGSSSPTSPSGGGVVLNGMVVGSDAVSTSSADVTAQSTSGRRITVTVENTSLSTTVSANGTFVFEGLPTGSFTLVFSSNGVVIGNIRITGARDKVKINIVVQVTPTTVSLVNLDMEDDSGEAPDDPKTCLISGGRSLQKIELEGDVASGTPTVFKMDVNGNRAGKLVDVSASGASFVCNGEKGGTPATCQASVKAGAKVHVKGTVVATEVKVQKAAD